MQSYKTALPASSGRHALAKELNAIELNRGTHVSLTGEVDGYLQVQACNASNLNSWIGIVDSVDSDGVLTIIREGIAYISNGNIFNAGDGVYLDTNGQATTIRGLTGIKIGVGIDGELDGGNVIVHEPVNVLNGDDFAAGDEGVRAELDGRQAELNTEISLVDANAETRLLKSEYVVDKASLTGQTSSLQVLTDQAEDNIALLGARATELEGNLAGKILTAVGIDSVSKEMTISGNLVDVDVSEEVVYVVRDDNGLESHGSIDIAADSSFQILIPLDAFIFGEMQVVTTVTDIHGNFIKDSDTQIFSDIRGFIDYTLISIDHAYRQVTLTGLITDHKTGSNITLIISDELGATVEVTRTPTVDGLFSWTDIDLQSLSFGELEFTTTTTDIYDNPVMHSEVSQYNEVKGTVQIDAVNHDPHTKELVEVRSSGELYYDKAIDGSNTHRLKLVDRLGITLDIGAADIVYADGRAVWLVKDTRSLAYGEIDVVVTATDVYDNERTSTTTITQAEVSAEVPVIGLGTPKHSAGTVSVSASIKNLDLTLVGSRTINLRITDVNSGSTIEVQADAVKVPNEEYHNLYGLLIRNHEYTVNFEDIDISSFNGGNIEAVISGADMFLRPFSVKDTKAYNPPGSMTSSMVIDDDTKLADISGSLTRIPLGENLLVRFYDNGQTGNNYFKEMNISVTDTDSYNLSNVSLLSADYGSIRVEITTTDKYGNVVKTSTTDVLDDLTGVITIVSAEDDPYRGHVVMTLEFSNLKAPTGIGAYQIQVEQTDEDGYTKSSISATTEGNTTATWHVNNDTLVEGDIILKVSCDALNGERVSDTVTYVRNDYGGIFTVDSVVIDSYASTVRVKGTTRYHSDEDRIQIRLNDAEGKGVADYYDISSSGFDGTFDALISIASLAYGDITPILFMKDLLGDTIGKTHTKVTYEAPGGVDITNVVVNNANRTLSIYVSGTDIDGPMDWLITDPAGKTINSSATPFTGSGSGTISNIDISSLAYGTLTIKVSADDVLGFTHIDTFNSSFMAVNGSISVNAVMDSVNGRVSISGSTSNIASGATVDISISDSNSSTPAGSATATVNSAGNWALASSTSSGIGTYGNVVITVGVTDLGGTRRTASRTVVYSAVNGSINLNIDWDGNDNLLAEGDWTNMSGNLVMTISDTSSGTSNIITNWDSADNDFSDNTDTSSLVDGTITVRLSGYDLGGTYREVTKTLTKVTVLIEVLSISLVYLADYGFEYEVNFNTDSMGGEPIVFHLRDAVTHSIVLSDSTTLDEDTYVTYGMRMTATMPAGDYYISTDTYNSISSNAVSHTPPFINKYWWIEIDDVTSEHIAVLNEEISSLPVAFTGHSISGLIDTTNSRGVARVFDTHGTGTSTAQIGSSTKTARFDNLQDSNNDTCLSIDTPIVVNGELKTVGDVVVGDVLITDDIVGMVDESVPDWKLWQTDNIQYNERNVTTTVTGVNLFTCPVHIVLNEMYKSSPSHPYLIKRDGIWQWADASSVVVGDYLHGQDGDVEVTKADTINETLVVKRINVENIDTFYAGEVPVLNHNKYNGCLTVDTPCTINGKPGVMGDIKVGDLLSNREVKGLPDARFGTQMWRSWSTDNLEIGSESTVEVKFAKRLMVDQLVLINGTIKSATDHWYLVKGTDDVYRFERAPSIGIGEFLYSPDGDIEVKSLIVMTTPTEVMWVDVEEVDTYLAGAVPLLSHNAESKASAGVIEITEGYIEHDEEYSEETITVKITHDNIGEGTLVYVLAKHDGSTASTSRLGFEDADYVYAGRIGEYTGYPYTSTLTSNDNVSLPINDGDRYRITVSVVDGLGSTKTDTISVIGKVWEAVLDPEGY